MQGLARRGRSPTAARVAGRSRPGIRSRLVDHGLAVYLAERLWAAWLAISAAVAWLRRAAVAALRRRRRGRGHVDRAQAPLRQLGRIPKRRHHGRCRLLRLTQLLERRLQRRLFLPLQNGPVNRHALTELSKELGVVCFHVTPSSPHPKITLSVLHERGLRGRPMIG